MSELLALIDGKITPLPLAHISITNRGFQFGEGIFTTFRIQEGEILNWDKHAQRLAEHCQFLGLENIRFDISAIKDLTMRNKASKGIWKGKIIVSKTETGSASTSILMEPFNDDIKAWSLATLELPRHPVLSKYKTTSYIERMWLAQQATQKHVDEILICSEQNIILETSIAAILWVHKDKLYFPSPDLSLLKSTTLSQIIDSKIFKVFPAKSTLSEVPKDAHIFAANALRGIIPIHSINSIPFPLNSQLETKLLSCLGINRPSGILSVN